MVAFALYNTGLKCSFHNCYLRVVYAVLRMGPAGVTHVDLETRDDIEDSSLNQS